MATKKNIPTFRATGTGIFATTFPNGYSVQAEFMIDPKAPAFSGPATGICLSASKIAVCVLDRRGEMVVFGVPGAPEPLEGIVTDALGYLELMSRVSRYSPVMDDELCLATDGEDSSEPA